MSLRICSNDSTCNDSTFFTSQPTDDDDTVICGSPLCARHDVDDDNADDADDNDDNDDKHTISLRLLSGVEFTVALRSPNLDLLKAAIERRHGICRLKQDIFILGNQGEAPRQFTRHDTASGSTNVLNTTNGPRK